MAPTLVRLTTDDAAQARSSTAAAAVDEHNLLCVATPDLTFDKKGAATPASLALVAHSVLTGGTDGAMRLWDTRVPDGVAITMTEGFQEPDIMSVAFSPVDASRVYGAAGPGLLAFDTRQPDKPCLNLGDSRDQINMIAVQAKGQYIAVADDAGDVRIIDPSTGKTFKVISGAHELLCTSVQFRSNQAWQVVTAGMDAHVSVWDFSRGRACVADVDLTASAKKNADGSVAKQIINPPWAYSLSTSQDGRAMAVGAGDGSVRWYSFESTNSAGASSSRKSTNAPASSAGVSGCSVAGSRALAHSSIVDTVAFVKKPRLDAPKAVVSGGTDRRICLWSLASSSASSAAPPEESASLQLLQEYQHSLKINWVTARATENDVQVAFADNAHRLCLLTLPGA